MKKQYRITKDDWGYKIEVRYIIFPIWITIEDCFSSYSSAKEELEEKITNKGIYYKSSWL